DTSSNTVTLTGQNMQTKETAVYYCARDPHKKSFLSHFLQISYSYSGNVKTFVPLEGSLCKLISFNLLLFAHLASYGQSLISSASVVKRPGESVTVSCTVSGFSVSGFYMSWIRQKPGQELEWIGYINEGTRTWFAQSLQGRVSITKDNNKNILYLEVKCLKSEDTAVYYCAR
ncbi:hypothetical protein C0J50_8239, partial [Silurus asotus]